MTFAEIITPGGYAAGEVSSAMQKCIRRGLEDDALFWATELDLAGFGEYVWKRLRIIASEDVGLAEPSAAATVRALYANWLDQRKKKDERHGPERLFLVHAVIELCRARKSRLVDHALIVHYEGPRTKRPVPDFALDHHTRRGKARQRGHTHFWEHGAKLSNAAAVPDAYAAQAREIRRDRQTELEL
jgi:replication-associated recombination protein RarA